MKHSKTTATAKPVASCGMSPQEAGINCVAEESDEESMPSD
jgi:hypothetical protein